MYRGDLLQTQTDRHRPGPTRRRRGSLGGLETQIKAGCTSTALPCVHSSDDSLLLRLFLPWRGHVTSPDCCRARCSDTLTCSNLPTLQLRGSFTTSKNRRVCGLTFSCFDVELAGLKGKSADEEGTSSDSSSCVIIKVGSGFSPKVESVCSKIAPKWGEGHQKSPISFSPHNLYFDKAGRIGYLYMGLCAVVSPQLQSGSA